MSEQQHADQMRRALVAVRDARAKIDALEYERREPIAIVGAACRLPGAADLDAYWRLLRDGVDAISEVPQDRWDSESIYDPAPMTPGKSITRWAGLIDDADRFDAAYFGISPSEAAAMDPQQRLSLEVAADAFENAGLTREQLAGSRTGVFIGATMHDYGVLQIRDDAELDPFFGTGNVHCIVANRLSYTFDLRGPSLATDTACSSSLVAIQLALQSLRTGECDIALAGGVNMMFLPELSIYFSQAGMMSADGRCKTFDARADGYVRGEGCGFVVLKRLSSARQDGDRIRALIRSVAVNQDGRTNGLTAPNGLAQRAVIQEALDMAGLQPSQVSYIEAHGTGTSLGDPIEVEALGDTYGVPTEGAPACSMGSVKTNIGHLEAAAGIAGLLKTMLAMEHGEIPPSLHLQQLNPSIVLDHTRLSIATQLSPWARGDEPRRAGINSFGFGGTNAHAIVEEAPRDEQAEPSQAGQERAELLVLSGHTPQALQAQVEVFETFLASTEASTADIAYSASARRTPQRFRLAVAGTSTSQWRERLQRALQESRHVASPTEPRVGFIFSGQGPQWLGMGQELFREEPVFRQAIEACQQHWSALAPWSLAAVFSTSEPGVSLDDTEVAQPALFALQWGLAALWKSWGIQPAAVLGHSIGEIAAACVAGALSLQDALTLVRHRGRLMQATHGQGAMASISLPLAQTHALLGEFAEEVSVAAVNSPSATVVAGSPRAVEDLLKDLDQRGVAYRSLPVRYAFHSRQMEALRGDLIAAWQGIDAGQEEVPLFSTLLGRRCGGPELSASYWAEQACAPVLFQKAIESLHDAGCDVYLEVGPHPVLAGAIDETLRGTRQASTVLLASLRRKDAERLNMLNTLGVLSSKGCTVRWSEVTTGRKAVDLPWYPWQRERFWFKPGSAGRRTLDGTQGQHAHALFGPAHTVSTTDGQTLYWQWTLDPSQPGLELLRDHVIQNIIIVPAAAIASMVAASASTVLGSTQCVIDHADFQRVLVIASEDPPTVQLALTLRAGGTAEFRLSSRESTGDWVLHATGTVRAVERAQGTFDLEAAKSRCTTVMSGADHYAVMDALGYALGPAFRCIRQMWQGDGELIAELALDPRGAASSSAFGVHPGVLDSCFQCAVSLMGGSDPFGSYYVPGTATSLCIQDAKAAGTWVYVRTVDADPAGRPCMELQLLTAQGEQVLQARSIAFQEVRRTADMLANSLYQIQWQKQTLDAVDQGAAGAWLLLADRTGVAEHVAQALRAKGGQCTLVFRGQALERLDEATWTADAGDHRHSLEVLGAGFGKSGAVPRGIVSLWGLDAVDGEVRSPAALTGEQLGRAQERAVGGLLKLVQCLPELGLSRTPRLWVVTQGAAQTQDASEIVGLASSTLWGLGRVLSVEQPELRTSLVDISQLNDPHELALLTSEIMADGRENQILIQGAQRSVARLGRVPAPAALSRSEQAADRPFQLVMGKAGALESLALSAAVLPQPADHEVVIAVDSAALNFRDVLLTLGIDVGTQPRQGGLGFECAGVVSAVGSAVKQLRVGQPVMALAFDSLGSHARTSAELVWPLPRGLDMRQAAAMPVAFCTAYHALKDVARLRKGESVLIHAGAGGVGQAAVQIARWLGAQVYATAGTPEKRAFLQSQGVVNVLDSRSLDFAEALLALTGGEGVDVVLNSLSGEFAAKSLSVLRPYGRFIEIGKRDIQERRRIELAPFKRSLSYASVDLISLAQDRPQEVREIFNQVVDLLHDGLLRPLPLTIYPIDQSREAFQYLAQGCNIGKVILQVAGRNPDIDVPENKSLRVRADASYLITGGLSGLGLECAKWLVDEGGRFLVLAGRSAPSTHAQEIVADLQAKGARVLVHRADVADAAQADGLAQAATQAGMPPLRGVLHAAGALSDGMLAQMDSKQLMDVLAPKVMGGWNLHHATQKQNLDFFVLFSSIAAVLGSPGQGNYAAANAFLDALARWRAASGLPATCVQWGPWADVGMAARTIEKARGNAFPGMVSIPVGRGIGLMSELIGRGMSDVMAVPINWGAFFRGYTDALQVPLLALFARDGATEIAAANVVDPKARQLQAAINGSASDEDIAALGLQWVTEQVAQSLWRPSDTVSAQDSLLSLGFDSLMLVDLRNRLQAGLGISLSITALPPDSTVASLALYVVNAARPDTPLRMVADGGTGEAQNAAVAEAGAPSARWVEIQRGQSGPPLIMVHALVPSVFPYVPLARALGAQQTVYGVSGPSLADNAPVNDSIEKIAEQYVEELVRRWPTGPILLGGHSFGGTVAYEMAQQLCARGRTPELLVMIDALAPPEHAARLPDDWRDRRPPMIEQVATTMGLDAGKGQLDRLFEIVHAHLEALISYEPRSLSVPLLYIRAKERDAMRPPGKEHDGLDLYWEGDTPDHPEDFWLKLATSDQEVAVAPGWHHTMLDKPEPVARVMRACIAAHVR